MINKEQLIEVAKAGYVNYKTWKWNTLELFVMGNVYRLYEPDKGINFVLPKSSVISISIEKGFVQIHIQNSSLKFNHLAAVEKIKELKLV